MSATTLWHLLICQLLSAMFTARFKRQKRSGMNPSQNRSSLLCRSKSRLRPTSLSAWKTARNSNPSSVTSAPTTA
ncbi:UNVERIFIED_CONTAM: hypothetical protein GTU68_045661 [Idotea baltica]|nr:hypothetical protein [Idotea baltica]